MIEILTLKKRNVKDFAKEKNLLLSKAKSEWVLFVDPDEIVSDELKNEIESVIKNTTKNGYYIRRVDYLFGKELKHGEYSRSGWFGNTTLIRLGRKGTGIWKRKVHEYWDIRGEVGYLKNPLLHYPHPTLKDYINNINYFSTLHAKSLHEEGKKSTIIKIIIWPVGKFIYNYIFRLGFLDGMVGFVSALVMSFHSYLSWSKLYFGQY